MPLEPGVRLDAYEIVRPLGSGGMGEVWLATEVRLGRKVALKLLPAHLMREPSRVLRFEQEARAASALNHPNVCTVHALGETSDGVRYIAMEYVDGETLRHRLGTSRRTIPEAVDIAVQVAAALSAAHASGIIHRDIKPENVMLRPDGLVKVLDFGLAKLAPTGAEFASADATQTGLKTEAGIVVGTATYMSPEQARGQDVDARTDIWSLGVLLYEMVAGRSPFAATSGSEVLAAILDRDPLPLARFEPETPAELHRIVTKCLRKDRALRYQVVQDLLLDLQALRDDLQSNARAAVAGPPQVPFEPSASPSDSTGVARRRPRVQDWRIAIPAAVVLVVAAGAAWWYLESKRGASVGRSGPQVARNLTRLTFEPGLQTDVTWSPDGTRIAYAADTAGNFDIWVQPVEGGEAMQLTKSPAQDTQPAWSPDGRTIVFRSERDDGGLYVVPALGGPERQLTSFGAHAQWTPDGAHILFRGGGVVTAQASLNVVSADGGESPRELLRSFLVGGMWFWIGNHPDGRISAVGLHAESGPGFFTLSSDGRQVTQSELAPELPLRIAEGSRSGQGTRVVRFQWSRDATALYVEAFVNEVRNIWRVSVEPKTLRWVSAERLTAGVGAEVGAAVSGDGTRIAFTTERQVSRLWAFPFDAVAGRLTGEGRPVTPEEGTVEVSALSRDGSRVAYLWRRAGTTRKDLWIADINSGKRELLAQSVVGVCWSPDGNAIAYTLFRLDPGEWALVLRTLSGPERLLSPWSSQAALLPNDWTPDRTAILGAYFAPIHAKARLALWPVSHPSSNPERILMSESAIDLWFGRYSPNGHWVAFVITHQGRGDNAELMVAPAGGAPAAQWVRIAADHEFVDKPHWAPDGRTLYFLSKHGSAFLNLWGIRFDAARGQPAGDAFMITRFESPTLMISPEVGNTSIGISADRAVLTMAAVSGNIWMLDNVDR